MEAVVYRSNQECRSILRSHNPLSYGNDQDVTSRTSRDEMKDNVPDIKSILQRFINLTAYYVANVSNNSIS